MSRLFRVALVGSVIALGTGRLWAGEVRGKVKSVDPVQGTITVTVGDADQTLAVAKGARITGLFGKKLKKAVEQDVPGGLRGVKEGAAVTLTTDKAEVSQLKLDDLQPKLKKKKKAK